MKGKILIVEDEAITALDLMYTIEELGYEVIGTIDTGEEAITVSKNERPDVVLMDIKLKGEMTGIEAAETISEFDIPVIYLTANTDKYTFEKSSKNYYGVVSKPYDVNKLKDTINKTFETITSYA